MVLTGAGDPEIVDLCQWASQRAGPDWNDERVDWPDCLAVIGPGQSESDWCQSSCECDSAATTRRRGGNLN